MRNRLVSWGDDFHGPVIHGDAPAARFVPGTRSASELSIELSNATIAEGIEKVMV